ncbi:MAG: RNA methyltransferase [bacterium]|nr:RNA methyltransferase [bacterium]MDN5835144.1 RNA methyltransferase [bacterium]
MDSTSLVITSRQNKTVKQLRALSQTQKLRDQTKTTILDGIHLSQSYLASGRVPLTCLVNQSGQSKAEISAILSSLPSEVEIINLADDIFDTISPVKNSAGIALIINYGNNSAASSLSVDTVLLDRVQDPGNIGTILRSAVAADVKSVLLSPGCANVWSPQTLRAGMGAQFQLDIYEAVDLKTAINNSQVPVYATSLQTSKSIYDIDLTQTSAWLFGNEGQGVADDLLTACTETVIIPQSANIESLNVAMSATVCLFEQVRQRQ